MPKIRVLVVDDSVVVRKVVSEALSRDPAIEVVGTAANGHIAICKIPHVNPDLITLDIEMPVMDGLEALREIRKSYPRLPVIMFSTLTERGASATLDALSLGASDYVPKPSASGSVVAAQQRIVDELTPKIRSLCWRVLGSAQGVAAPTATGKTTPPAPAVIAARKRQRVDLVAIGVSTGGPNALAEILPCLPETLPVPIVIVQHMPPLFTKLLADRLNAASAIAVEEGSERQFLAPGHAYVAPGDHHMVVQRENGALRLRTNQTPHENSCRPAVDVLFKSAAEVCGPHVLAVVLTGMGQDGLRGCQVVAEAEGQIFVQDQASSVVWGMPGFVANAGLADRMVPLEQVAAEIVRRVSEGRSPVPARAPAECSTLLEG
jgi:two-component system chemotaxis response regulator CheB